MREHSKQTRSSRPKLVGTCAAPAISLIPNTYTCCRLCHQQLQLRPSLYSNSTTCNWSHKPNQRPNHSSPTKKILKSLISGPVNLKTHRPKITEEWSISDVKKQGAENARACRCKTTAIRIKTHNPCEDEETNTTDNEDAAPPCMAVASTPLRTGRRHRAGIHISLLISVWSPVNEVYADANAAGTGSFLWSQVIHSII